MIKETLQSFRIIRGKNELLSSFSCLERALAGKGLKKRNIRELFLIFVDKGEYDSTFEERIITHLCKVTKKPR